MPDRKKQAIYLPMKQRMLQKKKRQAPAKRHVPVSVITFPIFTGLKNDQLLRTLSLTSALLSLDDAVL